MAGLRQAQCASGSVRADEVADEADALGCEQGEQFLIGELECRARVVRPAEARLIRDDDELIAGRLELEQRRNHARDERLLDGLREAFALRDERAVAIDEQDPTH